MKFMDSFLQGAKIWFAVSVIKADNLKDASNSIAFSSKHTRETGYFESPVTLDAVSLSF